MPCLFRWLFFGFLVRGFVSMSILLSVFLIIETFDKSRYLGRGMDTGLLVEYLILKTPFMISEFMPVILLLSAGVYVTELSRNREIMALRAAGLGINKIIIPLMAASCVAAFTSFAIGEWVTPVTNHRLDRIEQIHIHHRPDAISGIQWLREGYRLFRLTPLGEDQFKMAMFETDKNGHWLQRMESSHGYYSGGAWHLTNVSISRPNKGHINYQHKDTLILPSTVGPNTAEPPSPRHMRLLELWQYQHDLAEAGLASSSYRFALNRKLAAPLACFIMVLLAIALCTNLGNRLPAQAAGLFAAVALGLIFYVLGNAGGLLSTGERLPASFAAWLPNMVFGGLAGFLLLHREGY